MEPIAAISTPLAPSAIGVVRLTGDGAAKIAEKVFRPLRKKPLSECPCREMIYGDMVDAEGTLLDRGLCVLFAPGHSYTGEESAEFYCHGSPIAMQEVLRALFAAGARQAKGGEFTRRAFLNGKLDLTQAEAVMDLIDAETAEAARCAAAQVGGTLRRRVEKIYDTVMDVTSRFYAVVDYPDEDIDDLSTLALSDALTAAAEEVKSLLSTFRRGSIMKNGLPTAIIGRPNAGKSSLLNALLGYERAIVTNIPGTTRDTVEEKVDCGGVLLRLTDTAGIRETDDVVESLGVERSRDALIRAELALCLIDASAPFTQEDREALMLSGEKEKWILVFTKKDLAETLPAIDEVYTNPPAATVFLSAETGEGMEELEKAVAHLFPLPAVPRGEMLTSERQADAARRAQEALERAAMALDMGLTPDAILTDAEDALSALGALTGKSVKEDLVATIFSRFCVGK